MRSPSGSSGYAIQWDQSCKPRRTDAVIGRASVQGHSSSSFRETNSAGPSSATHLPTSSDWRLVEFFIHVLNYDRLGWSRSTGRRRRRVHQLWQRRRVQRLLRLAHSVHLHHPRHLPLRRPPPHLTPEQKAWPDQASSLRVRPSIIAGCIFTKNLDPCSFAKYFGSGVIIATSFIHLLAPAVDALSSPCLKGRWKTYVRLQSKLSLTSCF